jgi:Flp pilus assembly protein TadB
MSNQRRTASPPGRAGDRDRHKAAARLGQAFAQGYLQIDEYEQRVQRVFQAHTTGEVRELLTDLPLDRIRRADPRRLAARAAAARRGVNIHLTAYLAIATVVLVVWAGVAATTSASYFWPMWPRLGGAIGLFSHAMSVPTFRRHA